MKNHLKHLLAAAALTAITPLVSHAQNCDRVKETKDAFSGEAVKEAKIAIGPATWAWQMTLTKKGGVYTIGMRINSSGDIRYVLSKGEKIMIKLENGKIIELEMDKDYPPIANVAGTTIVTSWFTTSEVDVKVFKRLSHSPITDLKVVIQGVDINLPKIKDKQTTHIMDAAHCILGTTNEE